MTGKVPAEGELGSKAVRALGWVTLERWASRSINLIILMALTRLVSPADFGLISMASVATMLMTVLVEHGIGKPLVRREHLAEGDASTAFWLTVGLSLSAYGVLVLSSPLLAAVLGDARLAPVLMVLGAVLPLGGVVSVHAALLEREMRFRPLSLRQLVGVLVGGAVAIGMANAGWGIWALAWQGVATSIASGIALWVASGWRPRLEFSPVLAKGMLVEGAHFVGVELLNALHASIDKVLVGALFGSGALGYYHVAHGLVSTLSELSVSVFSRLSLTALSRVQSDLKRFTRVYARFAVSSGLAGFGVAGLAALISPYLLPVILGPGWGAVVPVFQWLCPAAALTAFTFLDTHALLAKGRGRIALLLSLGLNVLAVASIFVAAPFGLIAVAIARSVRMFLMLPLRMLALKIGAGLSPRTYIGALTRCSAPAVSVAVLAWILLSSPGTSTFVSEQPLPWLVVGLALYAGLCSITVGSEFRRWLVRLIARQG